MKKSIITALLALAGSAAFAQSASLFIDNTANPCKVYLNMSAMDMSSSPAAPACKIVSKNIIVPAYSIAAWNTVWSFQAAVGWAIIPSGSVLPTTTGFTWTDIDFQFGCPDPLPPGCSDGVELLV